MAATSAQVSRRWHRRALRRGMLATVSILGLFVGVAWFQPVKYTDANWNDTEHVTSGSLTSAQFAPPQLLGDKAVCERGVLGLLLIGKFEVTWTWDRPQELIDHDVEVVWVANGSVLHTQIVPSSGGPYSTSFSSGLLEQLIALLLGGGADVEAYIQLPGTDWRSPFTARYVDLNVPALIFPITCPILPR